MPLRFMMTGISLAGYRWVSEFLNCLFLLSEKSRRILSSRCSLVSAGLRSMTSRRGCFLMALAANELALRSSGPLTPKCVNSISPKSRYSSFLPAYMAASTFLRDSPCNSFTVSSSPASKGTRAGDRSVILWPHSLAHPYPSPVEPVAG